MPQSSESTGPEGNFLSESCHNLNGLTLMRNGQKAFKEIKGLKTQYFKGLFLTFLLAAVIGWLVVTFLYGPYVASFLDTYAAKITIWEWLGYIITPIMFIIKLFLWCVIIIFSLKVSTLCMGFWIDTLVEKVINHFRAIPETPLSFGRFTRSTLRSVRLEAGNLIFAGVFIILGLIPVAGPILGFIGIACTTGFDILSPYLLVLSEHDDQLLKKARFNKAQMFNSGWLQSLLVFIPFIGWLILPITMLTQVVGYSYYCESKWQDQESPN